MREDRYLRHTQIKGLSQERLSQAHVIVLGAGATGNEVIKNLALLGVGTIEIFDKDSIEGHNLTRSVLFRDADIAASKVEVAARRARELDANISVVAHHGDVCETLTLDALLEADVVVLALDGWEPRLRINQLCMLAGVSLINTSIDHRNLQVGWYPFAMSKTTQKHPACFACHLSPNVFESIANRYSCGRLRKALSKDGLVPTTIVTTALVAGMTTSLVMQALHDEAPATSWVWNLDSKTGQARQSVRSPDEECAYCQTTPVNPSHIPWSRTSQSSIQSLFTHAGTVAIIDPLLQSVVCHACGAAEPTANVLRKPAWQYTDQLLRCQQCGNNAREATLISEIRASDVQAYCESDNPPIVAYTLSASDNPHPTPTILYRKRITA
jgi:molybdopterin-synthase adenylyltransferase